MFVIAASETFTATVKVDIQTENGQHETRKFKAKFTRPTQDELDDMTAKAQKNEWNDQQTIDKYMIGWDGVVDNNKAPVEFSLETLAQAVNAIPGTRRAISQAFIDASYGASVKN